MTLGRSSEGTGCRFESSFDESDALLTSGPAPVSGRIGRARHLIHQPGTPLVERGVDGSVAQFFAVAGQAEDVGGEEFGDVTFVIVVDLLGAVEPTDGLADGGFGFDDDERQAVDEQHQVGAALGGAGAEGVLGGDDVLVLVQVLDNRSGGW